MYGVLRIGTMKQGKRERERERRLVAQVAEIRRVGRQLTRSSRLHDLSVANVVRRVLRIIRDEAAEIAREDSGVHDDMLSPRDGDGGGVGGILNSRWVGCDQPAAREGDDAGTRARSMNERRK